MVRGDGVERGIIPVEVTVDMVQRVVIRRRTEMNTTATAVTTAPDVSDRQASSEMISTANAASSSSTRS